MADNIDRPQYRTLRKIASIPIVANGFATQALPRDYDYETLFLRISASLQVTVLATSVRAEAPCQLVPRIEIIQDGKNTIHNAPFWFFSLANVESSLPESGARATTPPSGVAVATYAVEAIAAIDFMNTRGVRSKDSNFRSYGLSMFDLRLTFGAAGDAFVGGTVAFSGSPVVDVFVQQMVEGRGPDGSMSMPIALRKTSYQELALTSTNANQEILLPAGNSIKQVLVRSEGSVTAGEPSTAIINNVQLVNGMDVRWNLSGAMTRAKNNRDFGQITSGYYVADLAAKPSGTSLNELWDVGGAAQPKAILDVTGGANNKAQAVTTEFIFAQ